MVNPVLPSNTIAAGQSGHVADHNKITNAIQTVADAVTALEGNGSITTARLADNAVTSAKIADGAIVNADVNASAAIDVSKLSGVVSSAQVGNLLTTAQASVESSLTGWGASGNVTLAYDATTAVYGSGSCLATATSVNSGLNVSNLAAGSRLPVTAGRTYTLISHMRQAGGNTARTIVARFDWYSAATGGTFLGSVVSPATTSTSWVRQVATGVAPVGATHVSIFPLFFSTSGSIGDSANFDAVSFHEGAGGQWTMPGVPVPHLGQLLTESSTTGRAAYLWDDNNNRYQVVYYDTGWRDISSLLVNGWTGSVFLRRSDNIVMLRTSGLSGSAATSNTILTIPAGFRTESTIYQLQPVATTGTTAVLSSLTSAGVYAADRTVVTAMSATWMFSTTNTLPTSLPGTASGTIPAN